MRVEYVLLSTFRMERKLASTMPPPRSHLLHDLCVCVSLNEVGSRKSIGYVGWKIGTSKHSLATLLRSARTHSQTHYTATLDAGMKGVELSLLIIHLCWETVKEVRMSFSENNRLEDLMSAHNEQ